MMHNLTGIGLVAFVDLVYAHGEYAASKNLFAGQNLWAI
jgi:hypothetical protein